MRSVYSLDRAWLFELPKGEVAEAEYRITEPEAVNLPHTWNNEMGLHRQKALYQKMLVIPPGHQDEVLYLEFKGADSVCRVYLNGIYIGEHRGGYSAFRFPIRDAVSFTEPNLLSVYVDNRNTEDVSPLAGDFTIYGGLYRSVNLICVPPTHFDLDFFGSPGILIRPLLSDERSGIVQIESRVISGDDASVRFAIWDANGHKVSEKEAPALQQSIRIPVENPHLWDGKQHPYRYRLTASLEGNDQVYDTVELTFGFRRCAVKADQGFYLNDQAIRIQGVSKHQDFAGVGNAITRLHMEQDMQLVKEVGANAVRLSHYQHDDYFYDLCDREGLLVWAEIPMMLMPEADAVLDNAMQQLQELIYQNQHHPSICFWGIQNEIAMNGESLAMYRGVSQLDEIVRRLLPGELTASANMNYVKNSSQLNKITDIQGYNLYFGWYYGEMRDLSDWIEQFHAENPKVALGITEYGADCNLSFHSDRPQVKDYSEEFQALYHEETYAVIQSKEYLWGSFLWNLCDFGSAIRDEGGSKGENRKGLVTFDRNIKKDAFYYYKSQWSDEPFVHICGRRYQNRVGDHIAVKIYSNQPEVTLSVNGAASLSGIVKNGICIFPEVPLQEDANVVTAAAGECRDQAVFHKVAEADRTYVFVDPNPGINVRNWFTKEQGEIDLFPEDRYSILDTIGTLLENPQAWAIVKEMAPAATERAVPGSEVTLLWVVNKMRARFSEADIKELNQKLIMIEKESVRRNEGE